MWRRLQVTQGRYVGNTTPSTRREPAPAQDDLAAVLAELRALREEVRQIRQAVQAAPAQTGAHLAGALNGTSRVTAGSARWSQH